MSRPVILAAGLIFTAGSTGSSQPAPKPPTFPTSTDVVLVDFVVTDNRDRAVAGLTIRDFVVKEDGKERPIVSFLAFANGSASDQPGPQGDVVVYPPGETPPPPKSLAVTVLFVDDGQLSPTQASRLKPALKRLIMTMSERNGALALVAPWSNISLAREVEGNEATFAAAVDQIKGRRVEDHSTFPVSDAEAYAVERGDQSMLSRLTLRFVALNPGFDSDNAAAAARSRSSEVAHDARNRRADVYGVVLRSLDWLAKQPGRHSLVMVSGGYAHDPEDSKQQEVVTRSLRANAPIHFLDARGLEGMGKFQGVEYGPALDRDAGEEPMAFSIAAEGSSNLAQDTGGITIRNANDLAKGLTRLFDTMTTYYILGYEAPLHPKRGFRKIKVESKTKGIRVIARAGYFDDSPAAR